MTPEEHANLAVSKLKAAGFPVAFAHNKIITEAIRATLSDSQEFARIEHDAAERIKVAEAARDAVQATVAGLECERDTALSPAATFRERLERLVQAIVEAGQDPKEYSKLWIEVGLAKELLKSQTGKNLIDRLKRLEEAGSAGRTP